MADKAARSYRSSAATQVGFQTGIPAILPLFGGAPNSVEYRLGRAIIGHETTDFSAKRQAAGGENPGFLGKLADEAPRKNEIACGNINRMVSTIGPSAERRAERVWREAEA